MKWYLILIFVLSAVLSLWFIRYDPATLTYIDNAYSYIGENLAAAFLHKPVTINDLQNTYKGKSFPASIVTPQKKIHILIVPGHEPDYGGAEYGDLKERDMTVELSQYLLGFLSKDTHYDVTVTRDENGWNPIFSDYFTKEWNDIIAFFKESKAEEIHLVETGQVAPSTPTVYHNSAPQDVAYRLYGINKWEDDNNIDIAIHIHFNDNPRRDTSVPGKYSGFAIYVPESQYSNSTTTEAVANSIFNRLSKYNAVSNLPGEDSGLVQEPDLIAIGAYNTTNSASMLIEYGYIYQPEFQNPDTRSSTLKDMAFETYLGLEDFFGGAKDASYAYDTLMLPHSWNTIASSDKANPQDVLALQTALVLDGEYPPDGKDKNDCPRTGTLGACTKAALDIFQKKYGITGEKGTIGEKTEKVLNEKYSLQTL